MKHRLIGRPCAQKGFTLVELVVLVVIISILAAMTYGTRTSTLTSSRRAHAEALKSHIRYAQSQSMKTGVGHGVLCDSTAYWMVLQDSSLQPFPGEREDKVWLSSRSISLNLFSVAFDKAGRPYTDTALTTELPANLTLTLAAADDASQSVTLTLYKETGYVQ